MFFSLLCLERDATRTLEVRLLGRGLCQRCLVLGPAEHEAENVTQTWWAGGEAQENTLLRAARLARVLFLFLSGTGERGSRPGISAGSAHFTFWKTWTQTSSSAVMRWDKGGRKRSLGWIPSCLSPVLPALPLLAGASQATR